jgi:hypothetical protein
VARVVLAVAVEGLVNARKTDEKQGEGRKLVVIEAGRTWHPAPGVSGDDALVIHQGPREEPGQLSQRVSGAIKWFAQCGCSIGRAVLVTSEAVTNEVIEARYSMVRALLTSGVMAPGARVVLVGDERLPPAARHGLLGLAGALLADVGSIPLQFDIRLGSVVETDGAPISAWQGVPSA